VPLFVLGETVKIQAGVIRDHNQHIVPDGTVVQFTIRLAGDQAIIAQPQATTLDGLATVDYRIERDGIFEVTASSEPATTSGTLILNTQGGLAQLIMPTPLPPRLPTPTPTLTPTTEVSPVATETLPLNPSGYPNISDWLLTIIFLAIGGSAAYASGRFWWGSRQWGFTRRVVCPDWRLWDLYAPYLRDWGVGRLGTTRRHLVYRGSVARRHADWLGSSIAVVDGGEQSLLPPP